MAVTLAQEKVDAIRQSVDGACADQKAGIPGAVVVVVNREGKEIFSYASGKKGCQLDKPMTTDNVFWIASCTKMITGIACMQLVEKGELKLDDSDHLESLCPELKEVKVLQEDGKLVEKNKSITLRMLLTHTAGFGYTFFNEKLRNYSHPAGYDEFSGRIDDIKQPLVNQPGEGWEYGVNIDWAGIALERAAKTTLNEYMHANIFKPLGLDDISMLPNKSMRDRLAYMNIRNPDGNLVPRDHLHRYPLTIDPDLKNSSKFLNSGGAGCFSKPGNYAQILATLLNDGTSPITGAQILQKSTVDEMFRNQIPEFPDFARQGIPAAKADLTNAVPEIYPVQDNPPQGWGLTFMLSNGGATGRSTSTGFWAGLPNCWWWCDREKGVAGIVCSQILPFADMKVLGLWFDVEGQIYASLGEKA